MADFKDLINTSFHDLFPSVSQFQNLNVQHEKIKSNWKLQVFLKDLRGEMVKFQIQERW